MNRRGLVGQYAGFVSRAVALFVDIAVVMLVIVVLYYAIALPLIFFLGVQPDQCFTGQRISGTRIVTTLCNVASILWAAVAVGAAPVYFVFFWSATGQTVGQYLLGLRVVRLDGKRMTILGSAIRWVGYFVALVPLGLGFLWVLIDDRRQGWNDKMAGTCVLYAWEAEQNEFLLDRVRRFFQGRRGKTQPVPVPPIAPGPARNYDLVTISFTDYDRLNNILGVVQDTIAKGLITIVNATVLVKNVDGAISIVGASDLATGDNANPLQGAGMDIPEYELQKILVDIPSDSFIIAVVLEEQYGDMLTKTVARATPALIRRYDLGDSPTLMAAVDKTIPATAQPPVTVGQSTTKVVDNQDALTAG